MGTYTRTMTETRRSLLSAFTTAIVFKFSPSLATYGDSANVFGKITNKSGFVAYAGEGFSLLLPSKWNPSKEKDFPNVALRYEDNFDAVNNLVVIKEKTSKSRVEDFGSPEQFSTRFRSSSVSRCTPVRRCPKVVLHQTE